MGLDMFLFKIEKDLELSDLENVRKEGREPVEIGYWRKANQIHRWFVENIQYGNDDQNNYPVSKNQLITLKNLCEEITENKELAKDLLPTQEGFFFGNTIYNEYYWTQIKGTIDQINNVLETVDFKKEIVYYATWW